MYAGRMVVGARSADGRACVGYRIASRTFPDRIIVDRSDKLAVELLPGASAASDYISYNCARGTQSCLVATNGTHTDAIAGRLCSGTPLRDALTFVLVGMDREFDESDTPRIAVVYDQGLDLFYFASITKQALCIQPIDVAPGETVAIGTNAYFLAKDGPLRTTLSLEEPAELPEKLISGPDYRNLTHAVATAAIWREADRAEPRFAVSNLGPGR